MMLVVFAAMDFRPMAREWRILKDSEVHQLNAMVLSTGQPVDNNLKVKETKS